jgi:hypothetical protein
MDRAGWHIAKNLTVPANLTPLFLPPYSPELNAIERVWLHLRERFLSHRLWPTYDAILDACCAAWNALLDETGTAVVASRVGGIPEVPHPLALLPRLGRTGQFLMGSV